MPTKDNFDSIEDFNDHLGPGPVIPDHDIFVDGDEKEQDKEKEKGGDGYLGVYGEIIYEEPDYKQPSDAKHQGHIQNYAIGIVLFILVMVCILTLAVCIPIVVIMSKKKNKKVPYDKASLSESDLAVQLKQTGFENPIYKFYSENSCKEDN